MKPVIYLDTNVCRDCISARSNESYESIRMMETIRARGWNCVTSTFALMELYDTEKEDIFASKKFRLGWDIGKIWRSRHSKDLNRHDLGEVTERIAAFSEKYEFVNFHILDDGGWNVAHSASRLTNLSAPDCVHMAVAIGSECNILATHDQEIIREGTCFLKDNGMWNMMRISQPRSAYKTLEQLVQDMECDTGAFPYYENLYEIRTGIDLEKIAESLSSMKITSISDLLSRGPRRACGKYRAEQGRCPDAYWRCECAQGQIQYTDVGQIDGPKLKAA